MSRIESAPCQTRARSHSARTRRPPPAPRTAQETTASSCTGSCPTTRPRSASSTTGTSGSVYGLAYRMLRDRTAAEDVAQEAFVALWRTRGSYAPARGTPVAWLLTITRNRAIDAIRRGRGHRETALDGEHELEAPERTDEEALRRIEAGAIGVALGTLPATQRLVLEPGVLRRAQPQRDRRAAAGPPRHRQGADAARAGQARRRAGPAARRAHLSRRPGDHLAWRHRGSVWNAHRGGPRGRLRRRVRALTSRRRSRSRRCSSVSRARPTPRSCSAAACRSAGASARAPRGCRSRAGARR